MNRLAGTILRAAELAEKTESRITSMRYFVMFVTARLDHLLMMDVHAIWALSQKNYFWN